MLTLYVDFMYLNAIQLTTGKIINQCEKMRQHTKKTSIIKKSSTKRKDAIVPVRAAKKFFKADVKSINYQDYLIGTLKDPEEAAGYLNAALSGGDIKVFILALRNVVRAQGGVALSDVSGIQCISFH